MKISSTILQDNPNSFPTLKSIATQYKNLCLFRRNMKRFFVLWNCIISCQNTYALTGTNISGLQKCIKTVSKNLWNCFTIICETVSHESFYNPYLFHHPLNKQDLIFSQIIPDKFLSLVTHMHYIQSFVLFS